MNYGRWMQGGLVLGSLFVTAIAVAQTHENLLGRWDLEVHRGTPSSQACWMEVSDPHGVLHVVFVGPVGDAAEATRVTLHHGELNFLVPKDPDEGKDQDVHYDVHLAGNGVAGSLQATDGSTATFTGVRAPALTRSKDVTWGEPVRLFDKNDLKGWHFSTGEHGNWVVQDGLLRTTGHGAELISDGTFTDFKLHLEFNSGPHSNSGLYLRGRYEIQIETDSASQKASHHTGGVYGFLAPQPEQPRTADAWQTFDITFVGRTLMVVQNGITVIDHKSVPGITGGALNSDEGEPGPIYLQGSESGTTFFRNVVLTPGSPKD